MSNLSQSVNSPNVSIVKGSVTDKDLTRKVLKDIEIVFHEAAIVNVQRTMQEPEITYDVNAHGTKNMLESCVDSNVKRFVLASTGAVYGDSAVLPRIESTTPSPISPYARSKFEAEKFCQLIGKGSGLETVSLRYFNIYGTRSTAKAYSGAINVFAQRLLGGQKVTIYGDGTQSRDFINIKDIIDANLLAATSQRSAGQIFNVGTGVRTTVLELVSLISRNLIEMRNIEDLIEFKPFRQGDVRHSYADISLISKELGFEPKITVSVGLREYLEKEYGSWQLQIA